MLVLSTSPPELSSFIPPLFPPFPHIVPGQELLPKERSNVIDLERFLTSGQKKRLSQQLDALEKDSGIKVRLLCQR